MGFSMSWIIYALLGVTTLIVLGAMFRGRGKGSGKAISGVTGAVAGTTAAVAGVAGAVKDKTLDVAGDATGTLTGVAGAVTDKTLDVAGDATGALASVAGAVKDKAVDVAGDATGALTGVADAVADKTLDVAGDATGAVADAVSVTTDKVVDTGAVTTAVADTKIETPDTISIIDGPVEVRDGPVEITATEVEIKGDPSGTLSTIAGVAGVAGAAVAAKTVAAAADTSAKVTSTDSGDINLGSTRSGGAAHVVTPERGSWGFWPWGALGLLALAGLLWLIYKSGVTDGMGSFKWILGSLLAAAGIMSILGIAQLARWHTSMGWLSLGSGLLLGLASLFVWQPKIDGLGDFSGQIAEYEQREKSLNVSNSGLTEKLAALTTKYASAQTSLATSDSEIDRLKGLNATLSSNVTDRDGEITRLQGDNAKLGADVADLQGEVTRLKGLLSNSSASGDEITRLQGVIARLTTDNKAQTDENTRLQGLLSNNASTSDEITRLKGVSARLTTSNDALETENQRLRALLTENKSDGDEIARLNGEISRLTADTRSQKTTIADLQAQLDAKPRTVSGDVRPSTLSMINESNRKDTTVGLRGSNYHIEKMRNQGMVRGRRGEYYRIILRQPNGKAFKFASGSYSKVVPEAPFKASLDAAINDIKAGLDGKRNYQLYSRGSASAGKFNGKLDEKHAYRNIKVLERGIRNKYDDEPVDRQYGDKISNDDLPNLRGAYLQDYVSKNYQVSDPIILDGKVAKTKDQAKQAVAVILFVEK